MSDEPIPQEVVDYLNTPAGRMMSHGMLWFRWNVRERRIEMCSRSPLSQSPEKMAKSGTMVFVRDKKEWKRYA